MTFFAICQGALECSVLDGYGQKYEYGPLIKVMLHLWLCPVTGVSFHYYLTYWKIER